MLVSADTIAVIGYSYERGGTEVGLFNIDTAGNLKYRSTYHLRSNDYYSSRNYASRLIGNKLIFYSPLYLNYDPQNPFQNFPAMRRWHEGATSEEFQRIVSATRIFRPERNLELNYGTALHTVTVSIFPEETLSVKRRVYWAHQDEFSTYRPMLSTCG